MHVLHASIRLSDADYESIQQWAKSDGDLIREGQPDKQIDTTCCGGTRW